MTSPMKSHSGSRDKRPNLIFCHMSQAFFDESYDDDIYVIAGWVFTAERLPAFSEEWQHFLDMKTSIKYLKMNDAMTLDGEFKWWRKDARNEKIRLLMGCISDHASLAVSSYMPHRTYKQMFADVRQEPDIGPYAFMLESIVKGLADHHEAIGFREKIDLVFDEQVIEQGKIISEWESFKECNPEIEDWLGGAPKFKDH